MVEVGHRDPAISFHIQILLFRILSGVLFHGFLLPVEAVFSMNQFDFAALKSLRESPAVLLSSCS